MGNIKGYFITINIYLRSMKGFYVFRAFESCQSVDSVFVSFFMINLRACKRFLWDILSGLLSHHFSSLITQLMTSKESKVPHIFLEKMNAMESMLLACWGWGREVGRNDVILSETESALSF